jgi:hypothetical protein
MGRDSFASVDCVAERIFMGFVLKRAKNAIRSDANDVFGDRCLAFQAIRSEHDAPFGVI